jgi:phosphate/sulfate permease
VKTCRSDDRPLWSLLGGAFWIAMGTWTLWYSGILAEFG